MYPEYTREETSEHPRDGEPQNKGVTGLLSMVSQRGISSHWTCPVFGSALETLSPCVSSGFPHLKEITTHGERSHCAPSESIYTRWIWILAAVDGTRVLLTNLDSLSLSRNCGVTAGLPKEREEDLHVHHSEIQQAEWASPATGNVSSFRRGCSPFLSPEMSTNDA